MIDSQMELGFGDAGRASRANQRQKRQSRAAWWFARMRKVVDKALDWQPTPPARPEQIWLETVNR
jgi:hypothetical protein